MQVIKRGYVKEVDEKGHVVSKEPLYDHPELFATASDIEKARAEEMLELDGLELVEEVPSEEELSAPEETIVETPVEVPFVPEEKENGFNYQSS